MKAYQKPAVEVENIFSDNAIADGVETEVGLSEINKWGDLFDSLIK